jgi:simple sugar transport system ATP-binding protein
MRQGKAIETLPTQSLNETTLAEKIIGRKRIPLSNVETGAVQKPILAAENISLSTQQGTLLDRISFTIHRGEIVGLAGIEGNGQQELIEILANVRRDYQGSVLFDSKDPMQFSTYDLRQQGFSLIPPDRHQEGVILSFSLAENSILGHHREKNVSKGPFLSETKVDELAARLIHSFDVRPNDTQLPLSALSGGNQQKLVVARETSRPVSFLLAAHPTRGIDIGATDFIHQHFLQLKANGAGILLVSSELDEILKLSDRILVIYQGTIVAEVEKEKATESQLGLWMTSGGKACP